MGRAPSDQSGSESAQGQSPQDIPTIGRPPTAAAHEPPPSPPQNGYAKTERRWTQDPAMFFVTLAGVIAVAAYTSVAAWQAWLTRKQLNEMQAEQRPWVYPTIQIKGRIQREGTNFVVPLTWVLKNVGHMPALYVNMLVTGIVRALPFSVETIPNKSCDAMRMESWDLVTKGAIFPGQATAPQGHSPRVSQADYANIVKMGKTPVIIAIGCVDYKIPGSNKHHQTRFGYVFGPIMPLGIGLLPPDPTTVNISDMGADDGRLGSAD